MVKLLVGLGAGLAPVLLWGCSTSADWPPDGRGGIAETRPVVLSGEAELQNHRLACLRGALDRFKTSDAAKLSNATVPRADMLAARIARELAGGLLDDARSHLLTLDVYVDDLLTTAGLPVDMVATCES
jgi:hypothetical protein